MRLDRSLFERLSVLFLLPGLSCVGVLAQSSQAQSSVQDEVRMATATPLPNGIEVQVGDLREKVIALRDDVLRIAVVRGGSWLEDASWAVLPGARHSSVAVKIETTGDHFGFKTPALIV